MTVTELTNLIPDFLSNCKAEGKSDNTIVNYRKSLDAICDFFRENKYTDITRIELTSYVNELANKNYAPSTIRSRISAICSMQEWMIDTEIIEDFFFNSQRLKLPKLKNKNRKVIYEKEVKQFIAYVESANKNDEILELRNKAMVGILITAGLRRQECIDLKISDINLKKNVIKVFDGKGGKDRTVALSPNTANAISIYLKKRGEYEESEPIFLNSRGGKLTKDGIYSIVRKITQTVCQDGAMGAHAFRHAWITTMLNGNVPIDVIQNQAGHANINQTLSYSDGMKLKRAQDAVNKIFSGK